MGTLMENEGYKRIVKAPNVAALSQGLLDAGACLVNASQRSTSTDMSYERVNRDSGMLHA
jgi:hypothetical protein